MLDDTNPAITTSPLSPRPDAPVSRSDRWRRRPAGQRCTCTTAPAEERGQEQPGSGSGSRSGPVTVGSGSVSASSSRATSSAGGLSERAPHSAPQRRERPQWRRSERVGLSSGGLARPTGAAGIAPAAAHGPEDSTAETSAEVPAAGGSSEGPSPPDNSGWSSGGCSGGDDGGGGGGAECEAAGRTGQRYSGSGSRTTASGDTGRRET